MSRSTRRIEVFYDGDCPLCRREAEMVRSIDPHERVAWTDISSPSFDPASVGKDYGTLMAHIHGRLPDGTWVQGVDVFREVYRSVGFAPLVALSELPGIRGLLDWAYRHFARNRLRITGRCEVCRSA